MELAKYKTLVLENFKNISATRKEKIQAISKFISGLNAQSEDINLIFICTHNSRRSHFAQIWAEVAKYHFEKSNVNTFSGGTEESAFNKNAIEALKRAGLIIPDKNGANPVFEVYFSKSQAPMQCFSKHYLDPQNPKSHFIAIMVCTDADQNCPFIPEAMARFSLPFDDPKNADGSGNEKEAYDKSSLEIAIQMFYLISEIT